MVPQSQNSLSFDRIGFYKETYYKELDRKAGLNNEITLQGTTLVALLSGIFFLLTSFKSSLWYASTFFSALVLCEVALILTTGYYLFRSYYDFENRGRRYRYLSKMADIEQFYRSCSQQSNLTEFENYIADTLVDITDSHIDRNDEKTSLLTTSAKWMSWTFRLAAAIIVVFLLNYLAEPYIAKSKSYTASRLDQHNERRELSEPTTSTATTTTAHSGLPNTATTSSERNNRARRQNTSHH